MARKYQNLNEYIAANRLKKVDFAPELGVSRFQLSGLLYPGRYSVSITDELITKIAALINRPESYVRDYYRRKAAA